MMSKTKNKNLAQVFHYNLYGKREEKYDFLNDNSIKSIEWNELENREPEFFFVKKNFEQENLYKSFFNIKELFKTYSAGIQSKRDNLFYDENYEILEKRINYLLNESLLDNHFIIENNIKDSSSFKLISKIKKSNFDKKYITESNFRPFDNRFLYFDKNLIGRSFYKTMSHLKSKSNLGIVVSKQCVSDFRYIFISNLICDMNLISSAGSFGAGFSFPLYLYPDQETDGIFTEKDTSTNSVQSRKPNLNIEIVEQIAKKIGLEFIPEKINNSSLTINNYFAPIDILDYIYAVLHSPTYRKKYKEFLKIDFPRVPYPKDKDTFWQLVKLGGEIRQIHLLESPKVEEYITSYPIDGDNTITTKIGKKDWEITTPPNLPKGAAIGRIWINEKQYFDKIPQVAWEFYIGGYQPAQKWLKDRKGRTLSFEDILHYQKIIVALTETNRLMKEIDKIEIDTEPLSK